MAHYRNVSTKDEVELARSPRPTSDEWRGDEDFIDMVRLAVFWLEEHPEMTPCLLAV